MSTQKKETFVPLSQAHTHSERISFDLSFPSWVDSEQLKVNIPRLHRVLSFGGIQKLSVRGIHDNEKLTAVLPIGISGDGAAVGGKVSEHDITPYNFRNADLKGKGTTRNMTWAHTRLDLRMGALQQNISLQRGDLRKAESWALVIDNALRRGINEAGWQHLLGNFNGSERFMAVLSNAVNFWVGSRWANDVNMVGLPSSLNTSMGFLIGYGLSLGIISGGHTIINGLERNGKGYRLNFVPGFELDRAIVLNIATRKLPLVTL